MHFGGQNILEFHILVRCVQTQTLISKAAHSLLLNPEKGMRRLTNQTEPASLQSSKFSFEYLLLVPRSALGPVSSRLMPRNAQQAPRLPTCYVGRV